MRHRLEIMAALGAASTLLVAGCSSGSVAPGEVSDFSAAPSGSLHAWAFDNADDLGTARMDYAASQLPDVQIDFDQTAFDTQKFTTLAASGQVPDVVQLDRTYVTQYAAQGLIQPLDACFDEQRVDADERWYPSVIGDVRYQDKTWAAPQFYQPPAILLDMTVLDKAGVKPGEFDTSRPDVLLDAVAKTYRASGGVPAVLGFDPGVSEPTAGMWILSQGGQVVDDDGRPTLDDPRNAAGLELFKRITDAQGGYAKLKSYTDSFDTFGDANQFVEHQVGAQVNAQWYPNVLAPYLDTIDVRAVPLKDPDGAPFAVAGGTAFAIPTGAKNPAAACAWMNAVTSPDAWAAGGEARATTVSGSGGVFTGIFTGSPASDEQIREKWVKSTGDADFDEVIATYYDVVGAGRTFGSSPAGETIQSELNNAQIAVALGKKSASAALADAQAAAVRAYDAATADGS
ncbi:ABC transporter substrate-binding protein [Isoptericola sp. NPDC056618]|uniref:ABC transporter substrate-binding protein n=1 Tax=Isoptericola sp. NPDC056618 TaxID=3345878 RepID=UPI003675481D